MTITGDPSDNSEAAQEPAVRFIFADFAACFTYASYQNAVPVLRSISVENGTQASLEAVRLRMTSTPPFLRPKEWAVDRLIPGDKLELTDRKVELDAGYLAGLDEAERGEIVLQLFAGGKLLDERRIAVRLLARDEWGGVADMAQLLPAFVMPNDPAIAGILRKAAEHLAAHGHPSGLDGYQTQDPRRVYMLAAAIYSAIAGMGLHYSEPPASFERRGQKTRRPGRIAAEGLATCLDSSLLFCAALEAAGLNPVILLFDGHAAAGVWLARRTFASSIESDAMEVRKALASRELMVFETTAVTHRPPLTMEAAQRLLERRLAVEEVHAFVAAIDVRRARSGGVTPLASHEPGRRAIGDHTAEPVADLPLPPLPSFDEIPKDTVEEKPTTAAGRIDRWQKKLLDLTLRNRLLNFPDSKKTIPFLCTDVAYLEDRLADGTAIQLISLPEQNPLGERDASLYREVHGRDIQRGFAAEALLRNELASTLDARQLEARLIDLHRQVRNDFAEGGANTLFLAVGFLRWKKKPDDDRVYRAPLLLLPVKLERRSASSRFAMRFHEDEPRFNATLLQYLEHEHNLKLPQFAGELPTDDSGIDVPRLLAAVRRSVRDVPGMEVVDEAALSTFSFAKFLMWKDLVERTDALRQNRVVRHLIDTPEQAFTQGAGSPAFRDERELDRVSPAEIVSLLPADSSQTAASLAAAEGLDFVIVGPPGTGKSQTIANMIANCLAKGKTVLFVAEKTAALNVVYRRLREHGLGNQCIELHSNKADRKHFLRQLKAAWDHAGGMDQSDWVAINDRLKLHRDQLNSYVQALHKRYPNGWTPYLALGVAMKSAEKAAPALSWSRRDAHDAKALSELEELAAEAGRVFASVERRPCLELVDVEEWSFGWQEGLISAARSLQEASGNLQDAVAAFHAALGLQTRGSASGAEIRALSRLQHVLDKSRDTDISIAFDRDFKQLQTALADLGNLIDAYGAAEACTSAHYPETAVRGLDAEKLRREWQAAEKALWPASALAKRKIQKDLQSRATRGTAEPDRDLPLMTRMRACLAGIDRNLLSTKALPFEGLSTDLQAVVQVIDIATELRAALALPGRSLEEIVAMARALAPGLRGGSGNDRIRQAGERFSRESDAFREATGCFEEFSKRDISARLDGVDLAALAREMEELRSAQHLLRDWSTWCGVRRRASSSGLDPLIEEVESARIAPSDTRAAMRLAYARWWLPAVLDGDPVLRSFRRFQHENTIREFREVDDLVRAHATRRVVAAVAHGLPPAQGVPRNSELGLLRHQMELQRPSQSIRDMIARMPQAFPRLAPCMLMSPLSIAQYLPPNQALFDVVIFDEASQITTWDAVGAIARARQTIIVGDPKQLPPTNFFGRNDEDEGVEHYEKDLESILDEARASGIPTRDLRWHYRSRSESLIAFSNHHYYQNRLVTFPSPSVEDRAVSLRKVPRGVYDRGKSRTNRIEAEAVAAEAVSRMKRWLKLPERQRPTLGVITFNSQQQSLVLDLLDAARRDDPDLEWYFAEERIEPTIVKNLENVQGDERDVILFSITYWKDSAGKITMDFGALNRDGGERRLNVAVTRARQELIVFSGFTADLVDATRSKHVAVQHLKTFLDYAERGAIALPAVEHGSMGGFDSPFEEAVAAYLESRGWTTVPQVGISGFRIDLGIRHPDLPGAYLAGVECDGATYHGSATARDRDKVREQVLRGLGWDIIRVWSTDWWFDTKGCADRLHESLVALLHESRERRETGEADSEALWELGHQVEQIEESPGDEPPPERPETVASDVRQDRLSAPAASSAAAGGLETARYRLTDLSGIAAEPDRFFDFDYRGTLRQMVEAVIDAEAPVLKDSLAQRIARAHGWSRTGGRIRERIDLHLRDFDRTIEASGEFIWKKGTVADILRYRPPADEASRRAVHDIPIAELASVVMDSTELLDMPDPARDLARLLGLDRLAAASRARLDEAIEHARRHMNEASNDSR